MIRQYLAIALLGTGALALAGCGSMQVPERAIEAKHAADIKPASDKARDRDDTAARQSNRPARSATAVSARPASASARNTAETGCTRQERAVAVSLSKYPNIADHVRDAIADGQPVILHIDRKHADEHRAASTDDLPTKRGYDRDEYPPAMSREGGDSADVRYVKSSENRAAGASMGGATPWLLPRPSVPTEARADAQTRRAQADCRSDPGHCRCRR